MIRELGTVKPGRTLRIPFSSFDKDDGSTITMTNYAVADILIYKDGGTTERASTNGFTATTDFDSKTGKHLLIIDLADNTTADFFANGSEYLIGIDAVTVDTVTVGGWIARFTIGYQGAILDTTIATLSSQTSFTLAAGPADDNALVGCPVIVHDAASAVQMAIGVVSAYTGSTKTVTLAADPAIFTMAAKDNISFFVPSNLKWWLGTAPLALSSQQVQAIVPVTQKVDVETIKTNPVVNAGTLTFPSGATLASTTNITAGTITTTTNLTNLPAITAGWLTATGIAADAITAAKIADGAIDTATFASGTTIPRCTLADTVTTVTGLTASNLDATVSSRLASAGYTAPTNLTAAQIATGVWTDTTAGDFTTALSVGKSIMNGVTLGTGLTVAAVSGAVGSVTAGVTVTTNNDKTGYALSSTGVNLVLVDGKTLPASLQIIAAAAIGKISGAGTGTEVFVGLDGTTTRATVTVDSSGNRSNVVYV